MNNKTNTEHFPWLDSRKYLDAKSAYKIIASCILMTGDSIVMMHKAGNDHVEYYYIRDLVMNDLIIGDLDMN